MQQNTINFIPQPKTLQERYDLLYYANVTAANIANTTAQFLDFFVEISTKKNVEPEQIPISITMGIFAKDYTLITRGLGIHDINWYSALGLRDLAGEYLTKCTEIPGGLDAFINQASDFIVNKYTDNISLADNTKYVLERDRYIHSRPKYNQKNVTKDYADFKQNPNAKILQGATNPIIFNKFSTKHQAYKSFVVKSQKDTLGFGRGLEDLTNTEAALIKLKYDLYELLGTKVPKTYLIEEKIRETNTTRLHLASKIEPGYQDLVRWMEKNPGVLNPRDYFANEANKLQIFRDRNINGKPITGLFDLLPILLFLDDYDAIGGNFSNIGLIETKDKFITVKIDPEHVNLYTTRYLCEFLNTEPELGSDERRSTLLVTYEAKYLHYLIISKRESHPQGVYPRFSEVFQNIKDADNLPGLEKIILLRDRDLQQIIYNSKIPDKYLPQQERDKIFLSLRERRNIFREKFMQNFSPDQQRTLLEKIEHNNNQGEYYIRPISYSEPVMFPRNHKSPQPQEMNNSDLNPMVIPFDTQGLYNILINYQKDRMSCSKDYFGCA